MLAEAILRGEADGELEAVVSAAITRTSAIDVSMTPERYRSACHDLEARLLQILAKKRHMEFEGQSEANVFLCAASDIAALLQTMEWQICGRMEA